MQRGSDVSNEKGVEQTGRLHRSQKHKLDQLFQLGVSIANNAEEGNRPSRAVVLESFLENFDA